MTDFDRIVWVEFVSTRMLVALEGRFYLPAVETALKSLADQGFIYCEAWDYGRLRSYESIVPSPASPRDLDELLEEFHKTAAVTA